MCVCARVRACARACVRVRVCACVCACLCNVYLLYLLVWVGGWVGVRVWRAVVVRANTHHTRGGACSPVKCEVCDATVAGPRWLDAHMRLHTGDVHPFKCDVCCATFEDAGVLARHRRSHQRLRLRPTADDAPAAAAGAAEADAGTSDGGGGGRGGGGGGGGGWQLCLRVHTGAGIFKCGACAAAFAVEGHLAAHAAGAHAAGAHAAGAHAAGAHAAGAHAPTRACRQSTERPVSARGARARAAFWTRVCEFVCLHARGCGFLPQTGDA